ncbi:MAG: hypothetical protein JWM58_3392 [Rhizobium sp.]|nr:hypothetical protein [Rhizobium sp.]
MFLLAAAIERVKSAFTRVLAAAVAAALAYWLARMLLGQQQPIFAAITAIICLAPGIPSHFKQCINLLVGVSIGIVVGELVFLIPYELGEIAFAIATLVAMLFASSPGMAPVVPIQAGASALLVVLMGPQYAGLIRFLDVLIGVTTGLVFAVVFFRARLNFRD